MDGVSENSIQSISKHIFNEENKGLFSQTDDVGEIKGEWEIK